MSDIKPLNEEELEKVNGGGTVNTGWAPCEHYKANGSLSPDAMNLCGNCRYCDKYISGVGVITGDTANCCYPKKAR